MTAQLTETGGKELERYLKTLPDKVRKKHMGQATREASKLIVLPDALRRVPVKTGLLKRSLAVRTAKQNNGKRLPRDVTGHAVVTRESLFKGDAFYGGMLEFGTEPRQTKTGASRGRAPELRFLRGALYDNAAAISRHVKTKLIRGMNEEAKKSGMPR